jgi:hypothetical protein
VALVQDGAQFLDELCPQGMIQRPERLIEHQQLGEGASARAKQPAAAHRQRAR